MAAPLSKRFSRIIFTGANGFPGQVYTPFLDRVAEGLQVDQVEIVDCFPLMTERFKAGDTNWEHAVEYLGEHMRRDKDKATLIIGHSLGASLTTACVRRGYGGQHLCLVDPPLFGPISRFAIEYSMRFKFGFLYNMVESLKNRKNEWANRDEAMEYLLSKKMIRAFDPQTQLAYRQHGLMDVPDESRPGETKTVLVYPRETEAMYFATTPTELPRLPWQPRDEKYINLYGGDYWSAKHRPVMNSAGGLIMYSRKEEFAKTHDYKFSRNMYFGLDAVGVADHFVPLTDPKSTASTIVGYFQPL
eukprot:TRINITY_DN43000_c0_g1_i1.p1 TRINITY_DN43000_c0_g1~~TRINITY_DN43000_c0_g1_i1.p1  ORF type:complete len:302 (+),score=84.28 TRINITY_DN43000_c0_g1_i1:141-1046(+)